jgi:hypothetical protein
MARFFAVAPFLGLLLGGQSFSQSGAVIPQGGVGHADEASCVILKRMGPADQITSHLYSFGLRGKQFQYVEGKLPSGFPFHGRLTDHDVRNLQGRGAEVIVLNSTYTSEELMQARKDCKLETGKTPLQADEKEKSAPIVSPSVAPVAAAETSTAKLQIESTPPGADIEVDGSFVGNTPSDVQVAEGDHTIVVKNAGFKDWERKLKSSAGSSVHLGAELEKVDTTPSPAAQNN